MIGGELDASGAGDYLEKASRQVFARKALPGRFRLRVVRPGAFCLSIVDCVPYCWFSGETFGSRLAIPRETQRQLKFNQNDAESQIRLGSESLS